MYKEFSVMYEWELWDNSSNSSNLAVCNWLPVVIRLFVSNSPRKHRVNSKAEMYQTECALLLALMSKASIVPLAIATVPSLP